jgi:hypothetical protein
MRRLRLVTASVTLGPVASPCAMCCTSSPGRAPRRSRGPGPTISASAGRAKATAWLGAPWPTSGGGSSRLSGSSTRPTTPPSSWPRRRPMRRGRPSAPAPARPGVVTAVHAAAPSPLLRPRGVGARRPHARGRACKRRGGGLTAPAGAPASLRSRRERTVAQRPPSAPSAQQAQQGCRWPSSPSRSAVALSNGA